MNTLTQIYNFVTESDIGDYSDCNIIFKHNNWALIQLDNEEDAKKCGANTNWSIAAEENNNFNFYYRLGGPIYVLINTDTDDKFLFNFHGNDYCDSDGIDIDYTIFPNEVINKLVSLAISKNRFSNFLYILPKKYKKQFLAENKKYVKLYKEDDNKLDVFMLNDIVKFNKIFSDDELIHILEDYYNKESSSKADKVNDNIIIMACENNRINILKFLLTKGVSINGIFRNPLVYTAGTDNIEILKYLIENGADKDFIDDAIKRAQFFNKPNNVKYLQSVK